MKILVPVCLVFLAAIMGSTALKCYECNPGDPRCSNLVDHKVPIKDDAEYTTCFKTELKIENQTFFAKGGKQFISHMPQFCDNITMAEIKEFIRAMDGEASEAFNRINSYLNNGTITEDESVKVCICSTDLCNDNTITKAARPPKLRFWGAVAEWAVGWAATEAIEHVASIDWSNMNPNPNTPWINPQLGR